LHILSFFLSACCGKGDRNESTNVSISKLIIGTKPKRFDLVRLLSEQKQNVSICQNYLKSNWNVLAFFKVQKRNQNETELISYWIKTFPYTPMLQRKQNGTFVNYFQIFLIVLNVFVCFKLLWNQNRTFVFSKNEIKTKLKRYKLPQGFPKTKQNVYIIKKNFENGTKQKLWSTNFEN
jgi:hypothetical protein